MFANDSNRMIKLQYSSCTTTDKLEMKVHPPLTTIKRGRAVEIKVIAKPFCTCKFEGSVVFTVLDMAQGKSNDIEIPVELVTMLSTKLDFDELDCSTKLGEGSFGIVFLGNYRGSKVAIKKLKGVSDDEKQMAEFYKETAMLDKFRCRYIINYFGACFIPNKICMVTEYAQWGSVNDLMRKQPKKEDIEDKVRVKILLDAARGIHYLHNNAILHRDIKPDNILVLSIEPNIKINAKITDFGASRNINAMMNNRTFTKGIGSPAYMSPEVLDRKKYDSSADVYSFAISMIAPLAVFIYERLGNNMDLTIRVAFSMASIFFLMVFLFKFPIVNIICLVIAIMMSGMAATMTFSRYCPSLRDTGMVSTATGIIDFSSYVAAAGASKIFANAVEQIGWNKLILVWFGLMVLGVIISLPYDKIVHRS